MGSPPTTVGKTGLQQPLQEPRNWLLLAFDAAVIVFVCYTLMGIGALLRVTPQTVGPLQYTPTDAYVLVALAVPYMHFLGLLAQGHGAPSWLPRVARQSLMPVIVVLLGAAFSINANIEHRLAEAGFENCPARAQHGRLVEIRSYAAAPLPADCVVP